MKRRGFSLVIVARRISKATILELGLPRRANPDLAKLYASMDHVLALFTARITPKRQVVLGAPRKLKAAYLSRFMRHSIVTFPSHSQTTFPINLQDVPAQTWCPKSAERLEMPPPRSEKLATDKTRHVSKLLQVPMERTDAHHCPSL
jgi:hypothetical protein